MLRERYERRVESFLERLEAARRDGATSRRVWEGLFDAFLALTEAPSPEPRLLPCFQEREILTKLARALHIPFSQRLREAVDRVAPHESPHRPQTLLQVRALGRLGIYPNLEIESGRAWYAIRSGTPYLLTVNSAREDARWSYGSDLANWSRHEVRLATAISCTERGGFSAYLGAPGHALELEALQHVAKASRFSFMIEYASLLRSLRQIQEQYTGSPAIRDEGRGFEFRDFRPYRKSARLFARAFLVSHPLLLRTANHYLKASMLWRKEEFAEDALANLLFSLEGCRLLYQEIDGGRTTKLDRKRLRGIFTETYLRGGSLYEFIEHAFDWGGMRAQIVHPHLSLTDGWKPALMADDYFEYHQVARVMLTHLVTGKSFDEFELAAPTARETGPSSG